MKVGHLKRILDDIPDSSKVIFSIYLKGDRKRYGKGRFFRTAIGVPKLKDPKVTTFSSNDIKFVAIDLSGLDIVCSVSHAGHAFPG